MSIAAEVERIPRPITRGPEMEALGRFFPDVAWTGTIREGGMGPGTPTMTATGRGTHEVIQGGRWVVGTYEQDQFLSDGTFVLTWQLHWVAGWVPESNEYRATMADNYGHADLYRGWIDGDRLVFESLPDKPVRLRFTWDVSDPDDRRWRNEMAVGDGAWFLIEEYHFARLGNAD
jgi:Protein of unknown function (DUF1579)